MALSFHVFADKIEENKKSWKAKKNAKYIDI